MTHNGKQAVQPSCSHLNMLSAVSFQTRKRSTRTQKKEEERRAPSPRPT